MSISFNPRANSRFAPISTPRFAGDIEFAYYKTQFKKFPPKSIEKMAHVARLEAQEFPEHNQHPQLAKAFGISDEHVRWFNNVVQDLLALKEKDEEQGEELWSDLHVALEEAFMENGFDPAGNKKTDNKKLDKTV